MRLFKTTPLLKTCSSHTQETVQKPIVLVKWNIDVLCQFQAWVGENPPLPNKRAAEAFKDFPGRKKKEKLNCANLDYTDTCLPRLDLLVVCLFVF